MPPPTRSHTARLASQRYHEILLGPEYTLPGHQYETGADLDVQTLASELGYHLAALTGLLTKAARETRENGAASIQLPAAVAKLIEQADDNLSRAAQGCREIARATPDGFSRVAAELAEHGHRPRTTTRKG